jgi:hypothetical protein
MFGQSLTEQMSPEMRKKWEESKKRARQQEIATAPSRGRKLAPTYRASYDAGTPNTFAGAKKAADETYKQYWYDKANNITKNWTDKDYALISEPTYENKIVGKGRHARRKDVRVLPEGYDKYKEYQERIKEGVLDFSTEETHKRLINAPSNRGYGKRQYWVGENNELRQAVEAQADVMKGYLKRADIPLVQKYEDLDGFKRPDSFRGEGIYLNTGTAAHIDWNSGLKRMQRYHTAPDAELGTYSNVFMRPDPDGFGPLGKAMNFVGTITGNPVLTAAGTALQGGDLEDIAKGYVVGKITAPILEDTFASLGVDAELLGIDPDTFSDSMMDVQTTMLEGGSGKDALVKELGAPVVKRVVNVATDALPDVGLDIDFDTPDVIKDIGDIVVAIAEPVLQTAEDVVKPVIDVAQGITEPVIDVVDDILDTVGEQVVDPVLQTVKTTGEAIIDPIDDALDAFGSEVVDPALQAAKDLGQDIIDPIDDIIDAIDSPLGDLLQAGGDLLGGMLGGAGSQQGLAGAYGTPVEQLFDKELFKFDTEIKSTQEMLSPMMNSTRYG